MLDSLTDRTAMEQVAAAEIQPGEKLLWIGRPDPARVGRQSLPMLLFGIPWTLFSLFWMAGASGMLFHGGGPPGPFNYLFPLFGLPFVGVGIGLLTSPYWAARKARTQVYAVTDRRAMIISGTASRTVASYTQRDMTDIVRTEHANQTGDVVFATQVSRSSNNNGTTTRIGFFGIPEAAAVERLLLEHFKQGDA